MPGIDADVQVGPLELMASVGVELGRMNDRADSERRAEHRRREAARARVPIDARLITVGAAPAGGADFVLSIGGPDPGYYWLINRLVVGGLTWDTTAAGDAEIYVTGLSFPFGSASTYAIGGLGLSDLVDHATTLPNVAYYSPHQVIVQAQENLVALIGGGTAAQQYVLSAQIQVFRTIADDSTFTA